MFRGQPHDKSHSLAPPAPRLQGMTSLLHPGHHLCASWVEHCVGCLKRPWVPRPACQRLAGPSLRSCRTGLPGPPVACLSVFSPAENVCPSPCPEFAASRPPLQQQPLQPALPHPHRYSSLELDIDYSLLLIPGPVGSTGWGCLSTRPAV